MHTIIKKVTLDGEELTEEQAQELAERYLLDHMTLDGFLGGCAVTTPDGVFQAEVDLIR